MWLQVLPPGPRPLFLSGPGACSGRGGACAVGTRGGGGHLLRGCSAVSGRAGECPQKLLGPPFRVQRKAAPDISHLRADGVADRGSLSLPMSLPSLAPPHLLRVRAPPSSSVLPSPVRLQGPLSGLFACPWGRETYSSRCSSLEFLKEGLETMSPGLEPGLGCHRGPVVSQR